MAREETIYEVLEREHREVRDLISKLENAHGNEERRSLVDRLHMELLAHAQAESETLYAALGEFDETREQVEEFERDHDVMRRQLEDLDDLHPTDHASESWQAKLEDLRTHVEQHVEEEEEDLFDEAGNLLTNEQAQDLARQFLEVKQEHLR